MVNAKALKLLQLLIMKNIVLFCIRLSRLNHSLK